MSVDRDIIETSISRKVDVKEEHAIKKHFYPVLKGKELLMIECLKANIPLKADLIRELIFLSNEINNMYYLGLINNPFVDTIVGHRVISLRERLEYLRIIMDKLEYFGSFKEDYLSFKIGTLSLEMIAYKRMISVKEVKEELSSIDIYLKNQEYSIEPKKQEKTYTKVVTPIWGFYDSSKETILKALLTLTDEELLLVFKDHNYDLSSRGGTKLTLDEIDMLNEVIYPKVSIAIEKSIQKDDFKA